MDFSEYTVEELHELSTAVNKEIVRRNAPQEAEEAIRKLQDRQDGEEWKQPQGYLEVYFEGDIVAYEGKEWVSLINGNAGEPGVSGWRELPTEEETPPEFVQPQGYEDAYNKGDLVTYFSEVYKCLEDGTVWSPDDAPGRWEKQ